MQAARPKPHVPKDEGGGEGGGMQAVGQAVPHKAASLQVEVVRVRSIV